MKRTDLPIRLQRLLSDISYVTIATISPNGQPWNTPVVGCFDDDLYLYWVSWRKNQHSQNIAKEPRIFVVMYDTNAPEGDGMGLYVQMRAHAINTSQGIKTAKKIYDTSFFKHPHDDHEQFLGECPQRFYKATPERVWHNTDDYKQGHFVDVRREISKA